MCWWSVTQFHHTIPLNVISYHVTCDIITLHLTWSSFCTPGRRMSRSPRQCRAGCPPRGWPGPGPAAPWTRRPWHRPPSQRSAAAPTRNLWDFIWECVFPVSCSRWSRESCQSVFIFLVFISSPRCLRPRVSREFSPRLSRVPALQSTGPASATSVDVSSLRISLQ